MSLRPNRVLAALVGAVVLLAVIAGVVVANRTTLILDPATPAGVVQAYLRAAFDGDYADAAALLSPSSGCDASDVALAYTPDSARIVLEGVEVDGDQAVATIDVTEGAGDGPFESSGYSHTERITLARDGGSWKVDESPWLLAPCGSGKG